MWIRSFFRRRKPGNVEEIMLQYTEYNLKNLYQESVKHLYKNRLIQKRNKNFKSQETKAISIFINIQ